jgi:hypothetical protein
MSSFTGAQDRFLPTELIFGAAGAKTFLALTSILSPEERRTRPPFPGNVTAGFGRTIHGTADRF